MTALPRRIPPAVPRPGVVVDRRYRLTELLGSGGTADVFRGVDVRLRRDVAVKVFRPGASAVTAERFCQEAELLGRLTHPALVEVHDVGRHASSVYVVMRLVEGVTLREHLLDGPMPDGQVARLGVRLASALSHVHAAGVVHRDVKPSNILVGLDGAAYLTDFGISRFVDEPTRSAPGTLVGTVPYLAPEQLLGHGSGPASDIHALGLVLLEAVKGEREYPGGPTEAGPARALRPPMVPAYTSAGLTAAIEAMTRTDPERRPGAAECVRLLEAASEDASSPRRAPALSGHAASVPTRGRAENRVAPPPDSPPTVPGRHGRRRLAALSLAAGIALGTGGTAVFAVMDADSGSDARPGSRPAPATSGPGVPESPVAAPPAPGPTGVRDATTPAPTTPPVAPPVTDEPGSPASGKPLTDAPEDEGRNDNEGNRSEREGNGKGGAKSGARPNKPAR